MSAAQARPWWRGAVIYQVYPRSFADGNGDGTGDIAGIRLRLPHLAELGVDAVWLSPWYPSPMADAGYDIADHRDVDPAFGTLAEAESLIVEAHALGIRVIVDVVPNHCSDRHRWFVEALATGPGSPQRQRFWFRPGRGPGGDQPPTRLQSIFGGPAWSRVTEPDGTPGEWYLHLFDSRQPDFNWDNPEVRAEFEDVLRFWLDRGVDGIRIDSAVVLMKDGVPTDVASYTDRDEVHEIYRAWRRISDKYPGDRALIGEVWLPGHDHGRFANYLRPDELHTAFNFDFLCCPWDPARLRASIDQTLAAHAPVGAPATWVLSNHDVTRHVTRYGRADTTFDHDPEHRRRQHASPVDLALGTRRARAATLLTLALPGSVYLYQGEELGLWEVEEIPDALRQDPMWHRTAGANPGRDGCRVPLPWSGTEPPFGFSSGHAAVPWLPQPASWAGYTVQAQSGDAGSMLELYRTALATRAAEPALGDGTMRWLPAADGVLSFARGAGPGEGLICVANLSAVPVPLPAHAGLLLASGELDGDGTLLPPDATAWLRAA